MSLSDTLADMLTTIRNGQQNGKPVVLTSYSKLKASVLDVLKREGYIRDYSVSKNEKGHNQLKVELKYHEGEPAIKNIKRVSRPGLRVYSPGKKLPKVFNGLGISVISTSHGVISDYEARIKGVGGELLCSVF